MFNTAIDVQNKCAETNKSVAEVTIEEELRTQKLTKDELFTRMRETYQVMMESSSAGLDKPLYSLSGLTGGSGYLMNEYRKKENTLSDDFYLEAMARAFSTLEVNASMGKIVAAPTAGASGILPAALVSYQNRFQATDEDIILAMFSASCVGGIIAKNATISGAEGGCQAETGAAAAMAAAALVSLQKGSPEQIFHAAAFCLIHVMGLVCDPVGGLVEFPCALRNSSGVINAMIGADMALAGIESLVPFDEVVETMLHVGQALPSTLRETALGGLAVAPSAVNQCNICGKCN